jgi:hypothetical protein
VDKNEKCTKSGCEIETDPRMSRKIDIEEIA